MKSTYIILILIISLSLIQAVGTKDNPYATVSSAGVTFNYRLTADQQSLDCQLIGNTTGWVGIGFVPAQGMQSANFIIGYDTGGTVHIRDDWGTSPSAHASDTSLGGTSNVSLFSSSESAGITQLNFTIPLNSGDAFDRVMVIGQTYNIILGRGQNSADNYTGPHAEVGSAQITIPQPVANQDEYVTNAVISASTFPNPFSNNTNIVFQLKKDSVVDIRIYNTKGELMLSKPQSAYQKGLNQIQWDGRNNDNTNLPNGFYFCQIITPGDRHNLKLMLMR